MAEPPVVITVDEIDAYVRSKTLTGCGVCHALAEHGLRGSESHQRTGAVPAITESGYEFMLCFLCRGELVSKSCQFEIE